jgi:hypothetical protein
MKEIGGFFELELARGKEFHNSISLNSGRNCLEYILKSRKYNKIYIPYFICDTILEPIKKVNIEYSFYNIDNDFSPVFDFHTLNVNECFLYVNYFGLNQDKVISLKSKIDNLIIDNTQAFFAQPLLDIDTFYSPRKFFGVPDGGYLYTNSKLEGKLDRDYSYNKMSHLLKRIDVGAQDSYTCFKDNSKKIRNNRILTMSNLTRDLLKSIDYENVKTVRRNNFKYLHSFLKDSNLLSINLKDSEIPMIYPFMSNNPNLRKDLIKNKIFIATYWPNVLEWVDSSSLESDFVEKISAIPIDQRYGMSDMDVIINLILKYN